MKIGILTSGGDAPGMNSFIAKFVSSVLDKHEIIAFKFGYQGLVDGTIANLNPELIENFAHLGGSLIKNSRCEEFKTKKGLKKALTTLKLYQINCLVVLGGDGTLKGAKELAKNGVKVICIPSTIDNDLLITETTLGFDSAVNSAVEAIDKIKQTMLSHNRVCICEVMGRKGPLIAVNTGIATNASLTITKIEQTNLKQIVEKLKGEFKLGKESPLIVVKENLLDVFELAKNIQNEIDVETRACKIGYVQRGGSPSVLDRILASKFAEETAKLISKNNFNKIIIYNKNKVASKNILEN